MPNFHTWCRDNLFVVASVTLPLLIVGLFTAATLIPRWLVAAPQFDAIFTVNHYAQTNEPFGITFHTDDNRIMAKVAHHDGRSLPTQRLYRTNTADRVATGVAQVATGVAQVATGVAQVATGVAAEIAFTIPPTTQARLRSQDSKHEFVSEDVSVVEVANLSLINGDVAPDGYRVRTDISRSGLFGELFGMRAQHNLLAVEKDGRVISISLPQASVYRHTKVQLLGWTGPAGRLP